MKWNRFVIYLVAASIIAPSGAQIAVAQNRQNLLTDSVTGGLVQYELYQTNIDRMGMFMRDIRSHLDRTAFDFDALLDSLNYDAEEIIAFSKNDIAFEQYPGVLRGSLGTLFGRAGNSIDQSLLLAKLLRDAGYEARIVGTELSVEQAGSVLQAMKQTVLPAPPFGNAVGLLGVMKRYNLIDSGMSPAQRSAYVDYVMAPPLASSTKAYDAVLEATDFITRQLGKNGALPDSSSVQAELIEEVRRYYWVEFKDGAADPWESVHPVFAGELPFADPAVSSTFSSKIPEELQHRLRFQVFIERKTGNRLEVLPITTAWERPIVNLIGVPLTFSNIADSMLSTESFGSDLESLLDSAQIFVPAFNNGMAEGASFFDLRGMLIDPIAAADSASGLFATISGALGDALGQIGDKSTIPTLTAQWLEFVLISPDGTEKVIRRTTFDRIGAAARERNDIPSDLEPTVVEDLRTLMQRHTFMVAAGQIPRGYVIEAALNRFQSARPGLDAIMDQRFNGSPKPRSFSKVPVGWAGHLGLFSMFDLARTIGPNHRNYRSGPALVVHSDGLGRQEVRTETIDIASNPRRVFDIRPDTPIIDTEQMIRSGVWETVVEGSLLSGGSRLNTLSIFKAAEKASVEPVVLLPDRSGRPTGISADTYAAINVDLDNGYAIIIPDRQTAAEDSGWWRVDLRTGETLGKINDGRGGELAETLITMGISFAAFTYGAVGCMEMSNDAAVACCHAANAGMAVFTIGIGIGLQGAMGAAAGVILDLNRFGASGPVGAVCEAISK